MEQIEVRTVSDEGYKAQEFEYTHNGIGVSVDIQSKGSDAPYAAYIRVENKDFEGFALWVNRKGKELSFSIDHSGGMTETKQRTYLEWAGVERVINSIKILKNFLNNG